MPPFKRKMLVLIGAIGVGRDSLLKRLIKTVSCFLNVNEHTHTHLLTDNHYALSMHKETYFPAAFFRIFLESRLELFPFEI